MRVTLEGCAWARQAARKLPLWGLVVRSPGLVVRARRLGVCTRWGLAACCAVASASAAQVAGGLAPPPHPVEPHFLSVGVDTIPRGVVPALAQDRAGFLWVATGDGVVRYDGYRFRPQQLDHPDPVRRNLGWVRAMLATRDGKVWIGTENAGLAVHDPATGRISLHPELGSLDATRPTVVALAEGSDGAVWVGWHRGGLDRLQHDGRSVTRYRRGSAGHPLPDDRVQALAVGRDGQLWVGSGSGLSRLPVGGRVMEPVAEQGPNALTGHDVQSLLQADDGRLWVGTRGGDVAIVDPATGQVQSRVADGPGALGAVTSLAQAAGGPVWVGRSTGIDWREANDGRLQRHLRHDARRPGGLAADEVMALLVDRAGWVWVGGLGLGLQLHNPRYNGISVRMADTDPGSLLADADTRGLLQLDTGEIWLATRKQGVLAMDAALRVTGGVPLQPGADASTAKAQVEPMAQTRDGQVWLAAGGRLHALDRQRRWLRSVDLGSATVYQLLASREGSLWACTSDGLYHLRPGALVPQPVPVQGAGEGPPPVVLAAREAADGSLWVGTLAGLYRLPVGGQALQAVPSLPGQGLAQPAVIGLLLDRRQRLWLDTGIAGLHRLTHWDGRHAAFDRISLRHGHVGPPFGANLLEDARGRIWTQRQVYDPATDRLHDLGPAEGQHLGTGWFGAHAQLSDGRLLFGGSRGVLVVQPEHFEPEDQPNPLVLTELRINGQPRSLDPLQDGLRLGPEDRSLSVEFARLDYSSPQRIRYAWRLQGFDPSWVETGADQRTAGFSNLAPGAYRLQVRATHASGRWAEPMLDLPVQVVPAWWQQWWAHAAATLLLLGAVAAMVQLRTRHLRLRQTELRRAVQERTASLEHLTLALQRESAALQEASLTDPLTGLRNRRYLTQHIGADTAWAVRRHEDHLLHGAPAPQAADLVFFLIDIDHFKAINDHHGHAAGDAVLMQIRGRLERVFRHADSIVRWGGEEFLIVARGLDRHDAPELATRALQGLATQPYLLDDKRQLTCTCSLGFACFPLAARWPRALDWADTVNLADAALYAAKQEGRNCWVGVLDEGRLDEQTLLQQRPVAPWVAPGMASVIRAAPPG